MRALGASSSFRDPDGYLFHSGQRILRYVAPHAAGDIRDLLDSKLAASWMDQGKLVRSVILHNPSVEDHPPDMPVLPEGALVVEHVPISFRNYPYEWSPEMLRSAAELTLELAAGAMRAGFSLKDATPYNVIFSGATPVFVDLLSFRRRDPRDCLWHPYAQFVRTFALPLLAMRYFGMRTDELLLAHRDGLEPERLWSLCPLYRLALPPFLFSVTIPVLLGERGGKPAGDPYRPRLARDKEEAAYLLERVFARARRLLPDLQKAKRVAETVRYMEYGHPYSVDELAQKEGFVIRALKNCSPRTVLDIGCNTGHYSRLAAGAGARVVAIDRDDGAIDALWRSSRQRSQAILPLVIDIGRPPGASGWQNREYPSFLERARGKFDCVLMLALFHHLIVNERVPMAALFELAAGLTTEWAIVEYVDPRDANFQRIARGRDALHRDITRENFESAAASWFEIAESEPVSATRRVYLLRRKED